LTKAGINDLTKGISDDRIHTDAGSALEAAIGRLFDQLEDAPVRRWDALDGVVDVLVIGLAARLIFRDAEWSERQRAREWGPITSTTT
jgi:hypothetical protein